MVNLHSKLIKARNAVLKILGDVHINKHFHWIPYYKPESYKIKGEIMRQLLQICKPGDILLRGYDDYLDGLLIGKWSHVGMVLNETDVIHSMAEGVFTEDILNFFRTDRICVLRANLSEEQIKVVLDKASSMKGTPYDFRFDFNNPREVSCSEFGYIAFEAFETELGMFKPKEKILFKERVVVRPAAFLEYDGFKKVFEFSK